ncbi:HU family DNA-binding protein [Patescibacteria group bacterium]|nr:HU family DNA-binding protein [Patescibacteria group bacterium]
MNKSEIIDLIARKANISKSTATQAIDVFVNTVKSHLASGKNVTITGFGTFTVSKRAARNGVNPQTGNPIRIPASKVPRFKAGKALRANIK